jgi:hypothetical protein
MLPDRPDAAAPRCVYHGVVRRLPPPLALLALALLGPAAPAAEPAIGDDGPPPSAYLPAPPVAQQASPPAATPLAVVDGRIRAVDLAAHAVEIELGGDTVRLGIDRNTLVYLPAGRATVADLRPGDQVRVGRNGRELAYWIEVRRAAPAAAAPPSAPARSR